MLTYTIALGERSADRPPLTDREAADMAMLGFRFAEFRPETGRYRLSPNYRTLHNLDRGTLTFQALASAPAEGATAQAARPPAPEPGPLDLAPADAASGRGAAASGQGR